MKAASSIALKVGAWAMRGPQHRLHFYRAYTNGVLQTKAMCGASDPSFAYSETQLPREDQCCRRCWKIRGGRP